MKEQILLEAPAVEAAVDAMAQAMMDRRGGDDRLVLVGIQRRGFELAARLKARLEEKLGQAVPLGGLDITLYRDDWTVRDVSAQLTDTDISFDVEGASVILVDDVLYTGRTVRSAIEAILDFGRPRRLELAVLIDRGHRELPIQADYVGKTVPTEEGEQVDVYVRERDGRDEVRLTRV